MTQHPPYHEGERAVQDRINPSAAARTTQRAISDCLPAGALPFIENQSIAIIGSRDKQGRIWASIVMGRQGFLAARGLRAVHLDMSRAAIIKDDPLWTNLSSDSAVGVLLIDFVTRRRLRINGRMTNAGSNQWTLDIAQAYANCPRYIQTRQIETSDASPQPAPTLQGTMFTADQTQFIRRADTFFVASAHPEHGVDASHRGGPPGFVRVLSDARLRIPDYPGNNMFNTLGNFHSNPRAGLLFVDFQTHQLLQLTGKADIIWHLDQPPEESSGTQRYWEFECETWQSGSTTNV